MWAARRRAQDDADDADEGPPIGADEAEPGETGWMYVLTFPVVVDTHKEPGRAAQQVAAMTRVIDAIQAAGLHMKLFLSRDKTEVLCKIKASTKRLEFEADRLQMRLRLDPVALREADMKVRGARGAP